MAKRSTKPQKQSDREWASQAISPEQAKKILAAAKKMLAGGK